MREGTLPRDLMQRTESDCGGAQGFGEGPTGALPETAPGEYRTSTLLGLHDVPCTVKLFVAYGRWPLAEPLIITTPTPDPLRVQAKAAAQAQAREAEDRSFACIEQAKSRGAAQPQGQASPEVAAAVARLGHADASEREAALRDLKKLGAAARSAVPAIVGTLRPGYVQTTGYIVEALAAADPGGKDVAPIFECLLLQPTPYARQAAAVALGQVGSPTGATALARELDRPEASTRLSAVRRFRDLQQHGVPGVPALLKHLASDPDPEIRKECANVLPWVDPDARGVADGLRAAERDADAGVRERATLALRDLDQVRARRQARP
jgi:HEAT repeat protein